MKDEITTFEDALISAIELDQARDIKARVESDVMNLCVKKGLICEEDKQSKSKDYRLACKVLENDFPALCLLRTGFPEVLNSSDLRELHSAVDQMCEDVVTRIAQRMLDRKVE
ncbi:hypothetical protein A1QO_07925 [Vibrio genomosp. F10 str. ZF-129]|uniref:Uncharacterized protein n=1 Tax=Vibrio genomosp. F10 str. ZF-129 TaxID=1187848 RepID=A0A1E5BF69_9VIBR|nr:hypothetical protein [Vibrio genomosp. F10]OEE34437.1 hypothetical protein A1QO_07925 [Vibrio genomosp. F10 str. ZF-129]